MKTLKKLSLSFLAALAVQLVPVQARALDLYEAQAARAAEKAYFIYASSANSVGMKLWYVGSSTESVVVITSTTITFYAPYNVLDTAVGTNGSVDMSATAYDTFGELCDYISGLADYGCRLDGGKRDDNPNLLRDQSSASGTNDLKAAGGFDVKLDSANINGGGFFDQPNKLTVGAWPSPGKRLCLNFCVGNINSGGATVEYIQVSGKAANREYSLSKNADASFVPATYDDTTVVAEYDETTDDVDISKDFSPNSAAGGVCFAVDAHLVVRAGIGGTSWQTVGNHLQCSVTER